MFGLKTSVFQHCARQHILGFCVGRHAEARHVNPDDANALDFLRQQIQRHAGRRWDAKIDDDDRVVILGLRQIEHRIADVLEQLATHQGFRIERHIADSSFGPIEMRREGQAIDATSRAGQDRRRAPHTEPDAQRAEGRAHGLRLIMWAAWIIRLHLVKRITFSCCSRSLQHRLPAAMTAGGRAGAVDRRFSERDVHDARPPPRRSLPGMASLRSRRPSTCLPSSPAPTRRHDRRRRP